MIKNIYPIQNTKNKVLVVTDDGRTVAVVKSAIKEYSIKEGDALTFEKLSEIAAEGERHEAFVKATDKLSQSAKSEKEIRTALREKGYSKSAIDGAVDKLSGYGYLSDEKYVEAYLDHYSKKWGRKKLLYELTAVKGIPSEIAKQAVYERISDDDEFDLALSLVQNFVKKKAGKDKLKQKCMAFLSSRGIDFQTAAKATDETLGEDEDNA